MSRKVKKAPSCSTLRTSAEDPRSQGKMVFAALQCIPAAERQPAMAQGSQGLASSARADLTDETLLFRPCCSDPAAQTQQLRPYCRVKAAAPGAHKTFFSAWAAQRADGDPAPQLHLRTLSGTGHRRNLAVLRAKLGLCNG